MPPSSGEDAIVTGRKDWTIPRSIAPLWRHQSSLPRLPVPDLYLTCLRYLRTLKPFLSEEEFASARAAVVDFALGSDGRRLQSRLLARAKANPDSSWLIDWWNDAAYLTDTGPVVFYVSYFYAFKDLVPALQPQPEPHDRQVAVAASLISHTLGFRERLSSGSLSPDMVGGKKPQCSAMYAFLFNSCRIPGIPPRDSVASYPTSSPHIVVVRKRRFVRVDVGGLARAQLEDSLRRAIDVADRLGTDNHGIGPLTGAEREVWGRSRSALCRGAHGDANLASLVEIQSCAFVVCLDDVNAAEGPGGMVERARGCWHGDGRNRFYDKTLQFVVAPNGRCGFLGEHSLSDGSPTARMCDAVLGEIFAEGPSTVGGTTPGGGGGSVCILPVVPCADVKGAVVEAENKFDALVANHSVIVVQSLGRDAIKALGVPPDAFIQCAVQLAFNRSSNGRPAPTYEACSTRSFLHGRTETIRSCSVESQAFARAMMGGAGDKIALLREALASHRGYSGMCASGQGVDRHLLGLKKLVEPGEEMPAIFKDASYDRCRTWELSTSTLSCEYFESWGFGEVCDHGFGIGYTINKADSTFVVTCRSDQAGGRGRGEGLAKLVVSSMEEIAALVVADRASKGVASRKSRM